MKLTPGMTYDEALRTLTRRVNALSRALALVTVGLICTAAGLIVTVLR